LSIGLPLCRGKYIARLDSDDISCHNRLHPEIGVLGSSFETFEDYGNSYSPLSQLLFKILNSKDRLTKLTEIPNLDIRLEELMETQPMAVCIVVSRILGCNGCYDQLQSSGMHIDRVNDKLIARGFLVQPEDITNIDITQSFLSIEFALGYIGLRWITYALWIRFFSMSAIKCVLARSLQSVASYCLISTSYYAVNYKISDLVAKSKYWPDTVYATAGLHGGLFLGSYYLIKRTPFVFIPLLFSFGVSIESMKQLSFVRSVPESFLTQSF